VRAVVYPANVTVKHRSIPFLISNRIRYNRNSLTVNFPYSKREIELTIEDINMRLCDFGTVSLYR
jgi:hypothetical protein